MKYNFNKYIDYQFKNEIHIYPSILHKRLFFSSFSIFTHTKVLIRNHPFIDYSIFVQCYDLNRHSR